MPQVFYEGNDLSKFREQDDPWWVGWHITCPRCQCEFRLVKGDDSLLKDCFYAQDSRPYIVCLNDTCRWRIEL